MAALRRVMNELYLLRHAKAVPQEEGGADRDRPLEQRGRRAAQAVAQWIAEHRLEPQLVLCSPALRTRQTLDIVAAAFPRPPKIVMDDGLYLAGARPSHIAATKEAARSIDTIVQLLRRRGAAVIDALRGVPPCPKHPGPRSAR
jgi:phosphohistidine phosphatase